MLPLESLRRQQQGWLVIVAPFLHSEGCAGALEREHLAESCQQNWVLTLSLKCMNCAPEQVVYFLCILNFLNCEMGRTSHLHTI